MSGGNRRKNAEEAEIKGKPKLLTPGPWRKMFANLWPLVHRYNRDHMMTQCHLEI